MKPSAPRPVIDAIPQELKALPRWVTWRYESRRGRWAKVPISCTTARHADVTSSGDWAEFGAALKYYRTHRVAGLGFVFAGDGLVGVDLDDCRDAESGELQPWASAILCDLDSYAEVSPSGTGVKVFVRATLPAHARRRKGSVEIYHRDRYFTVTGLHLPGTPTGLEDRQEALVRVYEGVFGKLLPLKVVQPGENAAPSAEDLGVIEHARRGPGGAKFDRLFDGLLHDYTSASEADLALCGFFARLVGPDPARIEALVGLSALGRREKWLERVDYRQSTIARAIRGLEEAPAQLTLTRSIQEHPGVSRTDTREFGLSAADVNSPEAVAHAIALADERGGLPVPDLAFALARRLHLLDRERPEQFAGAVRAFCERAGLDYREFWLSFLDRWPRVRLAEGEGDFSWAEKRAREKPLDCLPDLGEDFVLVGSLAFYLARRTAPAPFFLPVAKVGQVMGMSAQMGSIVVRQLVQRGVITPVDGSYSFAKGSAKAKEYHFTWAVPDEALPDAA